MLAWSDYVVVTADSVSMASEAAAAGKLVYVASAEECTGRASPPTPPLFPPSPR
ncbi:hypothetical protein EMIHUDRAFT_349917, partial [Emiliania huxleyi CCMP1516]|uniref:Uncharacterized protein n=2 Tax=Emiliania huxleyi TaxID=2903 RepID=A0A0D3J3Y1_EMIH1